MSNKVRSTLVNISLMLVMFNVISALSVIAYILAWKVISIIWIASAGFVVLLLLIAFIVPVSDESVYKKYSTDNQYNSPYHKFLQEIPAYIWRRVCTCSNKGLIIGERGEKPPKVGNHYDTTYNHSLHIKRIIRRLIDRVNHK